MDFGNFFGQTLAVQVALGFGYLAYATAYAGLRKHHEPQDAVFITLAFGVVAMLAFSLVSAAAADFAVRVIGMSDDPGSVAGSAFGGLVALAASLRLGMWWRQTGRDRWRNFMRAERVHVDDGLHTAWDALIQTTRLMGQIDVHLKDGQVLRCVDLHRYVGAHLNGILLGGDGSVVMVVDIEDDTAGERHDVPDIAHPTAGTRLTYIPADEIARVDLRVL